MASNTGNSNTDYLFRKIIPKDGRVRTEKTRTPDVELLASQHRVTVMTGRHRFRSDFELRVARKLAENGRDFEYETKKIPFQPKIKNYTPDFWFPEYGFYVEAKGNRIRMSISALCSNAQETRFERTVKPATLCGVRDMVSCGQKVAYQRSGSNERRH